MQKQTLADKKRKEEVDLRNEADQAIFCDWKDHQRTEGKGLMQNDAAQAGLDIFKKAQERTK